VLDVVLLCEYESGEPTALDPDEVAAISWLTLDEILRHDSTPDWIAESMKRADQLRKMV
jgi:8-oxo-dGTP diphosphatase